MALFHDVPIPGRNLDDEQFATAVGYALAGQARFGRHAAGGFDHVQFIVGGRAA